jgi:Arc/MetJ-type ribon-helix-helix transcriptional regulator
MKGSRKLSQRVDINITYEMAMWLDDIVREGGFNGRGAAIRSLLQTIMDEDLAAHEQSHSLSVIDGGASGQGTTVGPDTVQSRSERREG